MSASSASSGHTCIIFSLFLLMMLLLLLLLPVVPSLVTLRFLFRNGECFILYIYIYIPVLCIEIENVDTVLWWLEVERVGLPIPIRL